MSQVTYLKCRNAVMTFVDPETRFQVPRGKIVPVTGKLSRVMIYLIFEMLEAGENSKDILKAYPQLTNNHIKAALHYAVEVIKTGEVVPLFKFS